MLIDWLSYTFERLQGPLARVRIRNGRESSERRGNVKDSLLVVQVRGVDRILCPHWGEEPAPVLHVQFGREQAVAQLGVVQQRVVVRVEHLEEARIKAVVQRRRRTVRLHQKKLQQRKLKSEQRYVRACTRALSVAAAHCHALRLPSEARAGTLPIASALLQLRTAACLAQARHIMQGRPASDTMLT